MPKFQVYTDGSKVTEVKTVEAKNFMEAEATFMKKNKGAKIISISQVNE
jgi:hypothetical protein